MFWTGFAIGVLVGGNIGVIVMALFKISKN